MSEAVTVTLAESGTIEEAANEALVDQGFVAQGPLSAAPAEWVEGTTYAKNALVTKSSKVYRSQAAGNKENDPAADADFVHWAPVGTSLYPLQNPALLTAPAPRTQQAHNNKPPASSAATAAPLETIGVGAETPV